MEGSSEAAGKRKVPKSFFQQRTGELHKKRVTGRGRWVSASRSTGRASLEKAQGHAYSAHHLLGSQSQFNPVDMTSIRAAGTPQAASTTETAEVNDDALSTAIPHNSARSRKLPSTFAAASGTGPAASTRQGNGLGRDMPAAHLEANTNVRCFWQSSPTVRIDGKVWHLNVSSWHCHRQPLRLNAFLGEEVVSQCVAAL